MRIFILLLFLSSFSFATNLGDIKFLTNGKVRIDSIKIIGNDITKDFIILRELTFKVGDRIDKDLLEYNRERIYSTLLFNFVDIYIKNKKDKNTVIIEVKESWYFYPLPFINIKNSNFSKSTYGMVFLYKNFRGRNETIDLKFGLGFDPFLSFTYYNPFVSVKKNLSLSVSFAYVNSSSKSILAESLYGKTFDKKIYSSEITLGKRFNLYNSLFLSSGFDYIEMPRYIKGKINASNSNIDRTFKISALYYFDTRDLKQFPKEGYFTTCKFTHKGFGFNNINYNIINLDYREYRVIKNELSAKWRIAGRHTFGKVIPYYDNSFFGFGEYIRGHRNDEREGNNYLFSSFELRYPIIKEWNFKLKFPLLPLRLTAMRIKLYLRAFYDVGLTFNNRERVFDNDLDSGYGLGLTILFLPHNAFRFEYAFNEYKKGEFIFGTHFSF